MNWEFNPLNPHNSKPASMLAIPKSMASVDLALPIVYKVALLTVSRPSATGCGPTDSVELI